MGGNVIVTDSTGVEISATPIDLRLVERSGFVKDVLQFMGGLDLAHLSAFGLPLWPKFDDTPSNLFSGSSSIVFDCLVEDWEILQYKPSLGDLDVMVPEENAHTLFLLLKDLHNPDSSVVGDFKFIGMNKSSSKSVGNMICTIFEYTKIPNCRIQVDFELLPFAGNHPTEWSKFSHCCSFEDVKMGVKSVNHKLLLRALVGSKLPFDGVLATSKSTWDNVRVSSKTEKIYGFLKFSVDNGIRNAYYPLVDSENNQVYYNNRKVFKEYPTSESDYINDLRSIFGLLFYPDPTKEDFDKMWSFVGLVDLIGKYCSEKTQMASKDRYYSLLWGKDAQGLYRGNPRRDLHEKSRAWNMFKRLTGVKDPLNHEDILKSYYKDYQR